MERILLSSPHMSGNEQTYINEAFETNWIAPLGPNVVRFEKDIANYVGVKSAAVTDSGTAAIHLALSVLGVGKGDTVFCSTFTFVASANPVLYLGADIVFIDSEPETWNMSPVALYRGLKEAEKKGERPKAIIVVNLYGQSAKMDELLEVANRFNVPIIEDAAESLGSEYKGKKSGSFGKLGIYSFNGNKIITTSGGGALVSEDEDLIEKAVFLATQARDNAPHYQHSVIGYNYRMSNVVAGIGRAQLEVLDERVSQRRAIYERYHQELSSIDGINFMPELENTMSNRWLTTLTFDPAIVRFSPYDLMDLMSKKNIESRVLWKPLHLQPLFVNKKFYAHNQEENSVSEDLFSTGLCLPSGSNMTEIQQEYIIHSLKKLLSKRLLVNQF
ncbi:MAG: aminotransferase class I/II-fold pyridoxal phosphate-dependent enzyme [Carnobacterium sp.]|uniref:DegT/DnrJ/EryC1/StrS family aminotransferase n=1 Tax=Carnobacterium sp. TaxID=48221 RepID=UPI003C709DC5